MSRIEATFDALRASGRKGLVPYITAGYPSLDASAALLESLPAAGADLIELGLPFSDPMADGPVIQRACEQAVAAGVGVVEVLELVAGFRAGDDRTPIILMGYLNPIVRYGTERFAQDAVQAGVDGLLMVDAPPEEAPILAPIRTAGIDPIYLLAPTSSPSRIERVVEQAAGFIYYVSLTGITGADNLRAEGIGDRLAQIRSRSSLPVAVGFGIKSPADALAIAEVADAVVIGSALVERLGKAEDTGAAVEIAREFLGPIRAALDGTKLKKTG